MVHYTGPDAEARENDFWRELLEYVAAVEAQANDEDLDG